MTSTHPLDYPIWNALCTGHAKLALGGGLARRYPPEIGPLSGIADQSQASYDALRLLAGPQGQVVLFFCDEPRIPPGWTTMREGGLCQMVCDAPPAEQHVPASSGYLLRRLGRDDVPEMVALATLTEPGPFRERTIELGVFSGIFSDGRLMAMAGQRLCLPHFIEVSAVCTHPDARGRGYARALVRDVMRDIFARHAQPFLHVLPENVSAIGLYESLGFRTRKVLQLEVLKNAA